MTNQEAVKSFEKSNEQAKARLKVEKMRMDSGEIKELEFYIERDEMAIKALELEQEPCEDCISRQAAQAKVKSICDEYRLSYEDGERKAVTGGSAYALGHAFDDLPPVTPQQKMGCEGCTFEETGSNSKYPCTHCSRCYTDKYKAKKVSDKE